MVEVQAQVMEYDESVGGCGGWIPLDGGGMSIITLMQIVTVAGEKTSDAAATSEILPCIGEDQKQPPPAEASLKYEYVIRGRRIDDRKVGWVLIEN